MVVTDDTVFLIIHKSLVFFQVLWTQTPNEQQILTVH